MRILRTLFALALLLTGLITPAFATEYTFSEAVKKGIVSMKADSSAEEMSAAISHLRELDPGMVAGFAFFFGGQTRQGLEGVAAVAGRIREQLPRAILVGGFSESVANGYDQKIRCGGSPDEHHFDADMLTSHHQQLKSDIWIDPVRPGFIDYYACIAKTYIDDGVTAFVFEAPSLMITASSDPAEAGKAFVKVADAIRAYAANKGQHVYFFGEAALAKHMHLDAVYLPARYYHTTTQQKYQNKIVRPDVGVGYSYALSTAIVKDTLASIPADTKAIFVAIDHWDSKQDDLRRFMELDAVNRRYLIKESEANAHRFGALFMPALNACGGCNPPEVVVDTCEKLQRGSAVVTEYSAVRCGDLPTIREALHAP